MKSLLKYFHGYKLMAFLAPLFKLTEALLELTVPLIIVRIIDIVIPANDRRLLLMYVGLMFLVALVSWGFSITGQFFSARAAIGYTKNLSKDLFKKTIALSQSAFDKFTPSSLVSRVTGDTFQIQTGLNIFFRLFLRSPFIVFGSLFMAVQIDTRTALYFIVMILILFAIIVGILLITTPYQQQIREKFDRLVTSTREQMQGFRVIRAFRQEDREKEEFKTLNEDLTKKQQQTGYISILTNPLTYVTINLTLILLLWDGAGFVYEGTLTQGQIVALVNYLLAILVEVIKLVMQVIRLNRAWVSARRVARVMNYETETDEFKRMEDKIQPEGALAGEEGTQPKEVAFSFNEVHFSYPMSKVNVLHNLNFQVEKGSLFGIIGGTGAGKSTVLHLISNIYLPTEGEILYHPSIYAGSSRNELRDEISVVSGKVALFKGTIRSNLLVAKEDATEEEMWQALEDAQAKSFVEDLALGLDAPVSAFGRNFSGGQKQRLTIARALLKPSQILIFDDATSALDYLTEANLLNTLTERYSDRTIILVSQRTRSIENADQILVMDAGHQVGLGTHEELLEDNQLYQEIYESQLVAEVE
ncbi:MAG TPA: ABC transporter ATP-binding protein [Atopostipes sp.]|nr:ABC transporter ATP-binding protein [Atopostipes sp.]